MQDLIRHLAEKNEDLIRENVELRENIKVLQDHNDKLIEANAYLIGEIEDLRAGACNDNNI